MFPYARCGNKVKHCKITKEGVLYVLGEATFESLTNLVECHKKVPLFRKAKLLFPVDRDLIAKYVGSH